MGSTQTQHVKIVGVFINYAYIRVNRETVSKSVFWLLEREDSLPDVLEGGNNEDCSVTPLSLS